MADADRGVIERVFMVQRNVRIRPGLAGLLSLFVPGLGQIYIGQYFKGVALFFASAVVCFGLGLCNVVIALDAISLAVALRQRDIERSEVSPWLAIARWGLRKLRGLVPKMPQSAPLGRPLRVDGELRLPQVVVDGPVTSEEAQQWLEDGRAEHASAATFARLSLELMSLGAPSSLVRKAHEAALDELDHAAVCFGVAATLLGQPVVAGPFDCLGGPRQVTHAAVAVEALVDGCLGEGVGARIAEARAARTQDPVLAAQLRKIAADEHGHAALAWAVLAWALQDGGPTVVKAVEAALPCLSGGASTEAVQDTVLRRAQQLIGEHQPVRSRLDGRADLCEEQVARADSAGLAFVLRDAAQREHER